jgi:lysophospholipase L1-like esterase
MRAGPREAVGRAALALTSASLVLAAAEVALRVSGWEPDAFHPPIRVFDGDRRLLLDCYPNDPRHYFDVDLRDPGVFAHYAERGLRRLERAAGRAPRCVEVRYNSERFRGGEVPPRRPGVWRVMVLGDSFSEGQGVREEDTWPRRLEARLNRDGGERYEVINGAHRANDFPEIHEWFYRLLSHEPDLVIYAMVMNDAEQSAAFRARTHLLQDWITVRGRATRGRYRKLGGLDSRLAFLVRERLALLLVDRATRSWYRGLYSELNAEGWRETQGRIRDMDQRMRLSDGRLLVARWPLIAGLPDRYPFEETHARIGAFLEASGIASHDLLPVLRRERSEALTVHPTDRHPNERAHELVALSLAPVVEEMLGELGTTRSPGAPASADSH